MKVICPICFWQRSITPRGRSLSRSRYVQSCRLNDVLLKRHVSVYYTYMIQCLDREHFTLQLYSDKLLVSVPDPKPTPAQIAFSIAARYTASDTHAG